MAERSCFVCSELKQFACLQMATAGKTFKKMLFAETSIRSTIYKSKHFIHFLKSKFINKLFPAFERLLSLFASTAEYALHFVPTCQCTWGLL